MERVKKELHAALTVDRQSLYLPDDDKSGSWFHQTSSSKHGQDLREPFVWSRRLHHSLLPATSLYVEEFGKVVYPITSKTFNDLVYCINSTEGNLGALGINHPSDECYFIPAPKVFAPCEGFRQCASQLARTAIEKALSVNLNGLNFNFECCFKGLALCQPRQKVTLLSDGHLNTGLFAKVLIDLPLQFGFTGGNLRASQGGFETEITYEHHDFENFYLTIVSQDNTSAVLEPVREGMRALLVFHLIWPDATLLGDWFDTRLIPVLLERARRVKDCLPPYLNEKVEGFSPEKAADGEEEQYKQLVYPMQYHQSMKSLVSYSCLPAEDRFVIAVLSLVNCLDANLTIIKTDADAIEKNVTDKLNAQVQQWFPSINGFPAPKESTTLDVKSQMIGSFQATLERELDESVEFNDYCYAALIIQPRSESLRLSCRDVFHAVLEHLEKRIPALLSEQSQYQDPSYGRSLVEDLGVVLDFCSKNPLQVWCKPALDLNVTKRLWQMCLRLKAPYLGTQLLGLLSHDIPVTPDDGDFDLGAVGLRSTNGQYFFCELVRDQEIVRLIADFVSRVAGWEACSGAILSMITIERLYGGRMFLMCYLAQQLHLRGVFTACYEITYKVSSVLNSITREEAYGFGPCDTRPYVVLILYLMDHVQPGERHQFLSCLNYYSRFDPYDLYYMVVGFKWQFDRMTDTCPDLYLELCRLLSTAAFETSERLCDIDLVELVKTFQEAGDAATTEALLNNICMAGAQDEPSNTPLLIWTFSTTFGTSSVEKEDVDDGLILLTAIGSVQQAREAIVKWLDTRVAEVDDFVDKEKQAPPASLRRRYDYFIKEVTCYFLLILLAEKVPQLTNPVRLEQFCSNLTKFSTKLLCHLTNVAEMLEDEMAESSSAQAVFSRLSEEVESRDESEVVKQMARLDLVRSFISEGDSMMNERTFATETACSDDDYEESDDCNDKTEGENSLVVDADR